MRSKILVNKIFEVLNDVVFPCMRGAKLAPSSKRSSFEGVHAFFCAKEIVGLLENRALILDKRKRKPFKTHKEGKEIVKKWAQSMKLEFEEEVDISVGVADVIVYADDIGIFEIGTTVPTKILLILKYISRLQTPWTVHFWPYGKKEALVFRNWYSQS